MTLPLHRLSEQEWRVHQLTRTHQMTTWQAARYMNLSPATVKTVRRNINRKLRNQ